MLQLCLIKCAQPTLHLESVAGLVFSVLDSMLIYYFGLIVAVASEIGN